MNSKIFSSMEIDAIGEILNISLGASATAVSTMLGKRVDITTPDVEVVSYDDFEYSDMEPAIAVEITYISGLSGSNIMLLKRNDVRMIVGLLMGMEISDEEFAERRKTQVMREPNIKTGWLARYARMVAPSCKGAVMK